MSRPFAAFDIDGTIVRWQLFHAIVTQLIANGHIPKSSGDKIDQARDVWQKRGHKESFREYEHVLVHEYLAAIEGMSKAALEEAAETTLEVYKDRVYVYTRDLIRSLKEQGYLLFAISGSQQEIVDKFAAYYGFDDAVGSRQEMSESGTYLATRDTPIFDKAKVVRELAAKHGADFTDSIAVGDSASDSKILEIVEQPIAFNPDAGLLEIAKARGWKIVIERKNVIITLEKHGEQYVLA